MLVHKGTARPGLPDHWRRNRRRAVLVVAVAAAAVIFGLARGDNWRADQLDRWWLMARFTAREWLRPPAAPDPDIVLVVMDGTCARQWPEPVIAWGPRLASAIDRLHASGARVIALDWFQTIPTDRWFPGHDERLARSLNQAGRVVMIKMLGATPEDTLLPTEQLLYALPRGPEDLGYADLDVQSIRHGRTSADGQRRAGSLTASVVPALRASSGVDQSFAARAVERFLGAEAELEPGAWRVGSKARAPLRPDGSLLVNYASGTGRWDLTDLSRPAAGGWLPAFRSYSLSWVAQLPQQGDTRFRDKIVLIGATFAGSQDVSEVPFLEGLTQSRSSTGVEIQANLVRTLLAGNPIREPGNTGLWIMATALGLIGLIAFYFLRWGAAALTCLAAAAAWVALAFGLFVRADTALPIAVPLLGLLTTGGGMGAYRALREERERREVLGLWGRYQDPRLVDYLLQHPEARGGEGREAQVTVLFADLKNFTKTVENLAPGAALQMLNRYLALMCSVILEHGGLVDKYLGDGLMAQWGVPEPRADHAEAAVRACLELERRTRELTHEVEGFGLKVEGSDKARAAAKPSTFNLQPSTQPATFGLRLTLHSGPVVVGWVGASRLEFTIIGDTVNVTSRLQETAKALECEFLISESTYEHVRPWIQTGQEAEVEIRGRQQPLRVYEVVGVRC